MASLARAYPVGIDANDVHVRVFDIVNGDAEDALGCGPADVEVLQCFRAGAVSGLRISGLGPRVYFPPRRFRLVRRRGDNRRPGGST